MYSIGSVDLLSSFTLQETCKNLDLVFLCGELTVKGISAMGSIPPRNYTSLHVECESKSTLPFSTKNQVLIEVNK